MIRVILMHSFLTIVLFTTALMATKSAHATTYAWNATGGDFEDSSAWTPNAIPGANDTAKFALNGSQDVGFEQSHTVANVSVLAGDVQFFPRSNSTKLSVNSTDDSTVSLPNVNGGTSLTIGVFTGTPFQLATPHLDLENGASMYVTDGSLLTVGRDGMDPFALNADLRLNGTLNVSGSGSNLIDSSTNTFGGWRDVIHHVGLNGGTGLLQFQNYSIDNLIFGPLLIADDLTTGTGEVDVMSNAKLSIAGNLSMATHNLIGQHATLYIDGAGSALTQSNDVFGNATGVAIGSDAIGSAAIFVGTQVSGGTLTINGIGFNKTGTLVVGSSTTTGTLNVGGDVYLYGGTLRVYSGSLFNLASGKTLTIDGGATADFKSFNINGSIVSFFSGTLNYAGNLLVGTGGPLGADLNLGGSRQLSLTGTTSVDSLHSLVLSGGTLHTGALVNNGYLEIATGILTTGAATLAAGGTLEIDLAGTTRNTQYGALQASGSVSLAGLLLVTRGSFSPIAGNSFDILDGSLSGVFSTVTLPSLPAGLAWDTSQLYMNGVISVVSITTLLGDFNRNGRVDAADYVVWRKGLGPTYAQNDYNVWRSHFGQTAGNGSSVSASAAVPEPAAITILVIAVFCVFACAIPRHRQQWPTTQYGPTQLYFATEFLIRTRSPHAISRCAVTTSLGRPLYATATMLGLVALGQLPASSALATISAGTTTVSSIGHSFAPKDPIVGHPAIVTDFLVNQTQEVGGGAVLPAVTINLDTDTSISYTIAAPLGEQFVIHVPPGVSAYMFPWLEWQVPANDSGTSQGLSVNFQNVVGTPPSFPNSSAVGANNKFFDFVSETPAFTGDLSFTSVTFTTTYSPRSLGQGPLTYQPTGFVQPFGTSSSNANFTIAYQTTEAADPGRFVSLATFFSGDYNGNGIVDAADYVVWRKGTGNTYAQTDYTTWRAHFGQAAGSGSSLGATGSASAVPEPTSIVLFGLAIALALPTQRSKLKPSVSFAGNSSRPLVIAPAADRAKNRFTIGK